MNFQFLGDHAVGGLECRVDVAVLQRTGPGQVGAEFVKQSRRRWFDRLVDVDIGTQRFVVDLDQLQGIFRRAAIPGGHRADRFADIADFVHGAGVLIDRALQTGGIAARLERLGQFFNIVGGDHGKDVGIV